MQAPWRSIGVVLGVFVFLRSLSSKPIALRCFKGCTRCARLGPNPTEKADVIPGIPGSLGLHTVRPLSANSHPGFTEDFRGGVCSCSHPGIAASRNPAFFLVFALRYRLSTPTYVPPSQFMDSLTFFCGFCFIWGCRPASRYSFSMVSPGREARSNGANNQTRSGFYRCPLTGCLGAVFLTIILITTSAIVVIITLIRTPFGSSRFGSRRRIYGRTAVRRVSLRLTP